MLNNNILINFAIDLAAILIFTGLFYYLRHRRRDLFVTFTFFNIAMFVIVTLIANSQIGLGASFGLFALLAIIRLRSEEFSNLEVGYFFGCLTLAIINGLGVKNYYLLVGMDAVILLSIWLLDHPRVLGGVQHTKVSLDAVYANESKMVKDLTKLVGGQVLNFTVIKIDNVRDITNVSVVYRKQDIAHK
jgi:hypothetical protein